MSLYESVFQNNREWVAQQLQEDPECFNEMAKGQAPEFLYIGCSDSRVQPEDFMGVKPGQVFVHRNIANLIPNNDLSAASVIQYAVEHLGVKHIIVCGHYGCGGIKAAMANKSLGTLNMWIRNIDDVYRLHRSEIESQPDDDAKFRRLVELNVEEQCLNIMKFEFIQRARQNGEYPRIHGWVYDIATGNVVDRKVDLNKYQEELELYRLD
ncbi:carbonic anhydrase [Spirosoma soli]|uniref:Carbonic anhydrase n=1 Tax=Spirosoma soli TaxID=1770529 RepID=A0ABW5M9D5_9BACT